MRVRSSGAMEGMICRFRRRAVGVEPAQGEVGLTGLLSGPGSGRSIAGATALALWGHRDEIFDGAV